MNVSDQIDALEQRVADLKSSFGQARKETNEQVKARIVSPQPAPPATYQ